MDLGVAYSHPDEWFAAEADLAQSQWLPLTAEYGACEQHLNDSSPYRGFSLQRTPICRYLHEEDHLCHAPFIFDTNHGSVDVFPRAPTDLHFLEPTIGRVDSDLTVSSLDPCGDASMATLSIYDDGQQTSTSSPDMSAMSPDPVYHDALFYSHEDHLLGAGLPMGTISMHDVQKFADQLAVFEEDPTVYGGLAHDGYHPVGSSLADGPDSSHCHSSYESDAVTSTATSRQSTDSPVLRHRRAPARIQPAPQTTPNRISKRPTAARRSSTLRTSESHGNGSAANDSAATARLFHCPLAPHGCVSHFGSKNEWKRHFSTQHLRLGFWRCDRCPSGAAGRKPNDFNRKDLFVQHIRRMHPLSPADCDGDGDGNGNDNRTNRSSTPSPSAARRSRARKAKPDDADAALVEAANRCYRRLRAPPAKSICVVCGERFAGPGSWSDRMEHLGRHFEGAKRDAGVAAEGPLSLDVKDWRRDEDAERWMVEEGVLVKGGDGRVVLSEEGKN